MLDAISCMLNLFSPSFSWVENRVLEVKKWVAHYVLVSTSLSRQSIMVVSNLDEVHVGLWFRDKVLTLLF